MNNNVMTLAEIGAKFQETRVHRGVLIEDVAKTLKISSKILRAIEDGDREALPQLVFLCGFVKSYGLFLGFSNADLQKVLEHLEENEPKPNLAPRPIEKSTYMSDTPYVSKKMLRKRAIMTAIIAVIVLALSYAIYTFLFTPIEVKEEEKKAVVETPVVNKEAQSLTQSVESLVRQVGAEDQVDKAIAIQNKREEEALNALTAEVANQIAQDAAAEAENTANEEASPEVLIETPVDSSTLVENVPDFVDDDELARKREEQSNTNYARVTSFGSGWRTLIVSANEECWISFELDYGAPREIYLAPGEEAFVRFDTEARLRVGNAGGINITYNGENLGAPGRPGQVRRLVYPFR